MFMWACVAAWCGLGGIRARPRSSGCWEWSPWCEESKGKTEGPLELRNGTGAEMIPEPGMLQSDEQDSRGLIATNRGGDRKLDASTNVSLVNFGSAALSVGSILFIVGTCILVGWCALRCRGGMLAAVMEHTTGEGRGQGANQTASVVGPSQQAALMAPSTEAIILKAFDRMSGSRFSNRSRFEDRRRNQDDRGDRFDHLRRSARSNDGDQ